MPLNTTSKTYIQAIALFAALAMLFPLPVMQYIGEEGLYAIKSYEMFMRHDLLHPSILGNIWPHSPVYHWPVIGLCQLIGWEHVDIAVRFISVCASWISAAVAALMARHLFPEHDYAGWLAAAIYLSMGEVSFWYGWLGYVDASFGCFIFTSIAALWIAIEKESKAWFLASLLLISVAFLLKNITAYALFGLAALVLVQRMQRWHLLKNPAFIIPGIISLSVPFSYNYFIIHSSGNAMTTVRDAMRNFEGFGLLDYMAHWLSYPFIFIFRALPVSLFVVWLWLSRKHVFRLHDDLLTLGFIILACLAPFWLSAGGTPRYLVPLYGLAAVLLTGLCLQLETKLFRTTIWLITVFVLLKIPYSFGILPYIKDWRPERDVKVVAEEIMHLTADAPLRTQNDVSTGLAIAAYLDVWRQDRPPIHWYRDRYQEKGIYIMAEKESPQLGRLIKTWRLRGDTVYLYWLPE